jgi:hypothetical protein
MLQELAAQTGATAWAIASMLFFLGLWLVITVQVFRAGSEEMEARARLVLDGDDDRKAENASDAGTTA